jgi:hypothetical protein
MRLRAAAKSSLCPRGLLYLCFSDARSAKRSTGRKFNYLLVVLCLTYVPQRSSESDSCRIFMRSKSRSKDYARTNTVFRPAMARRGSPGMYTHRNTTLAMSRTSAHQSLHNLSLNWEQTDKPNVANYQASGADDVEGALSGHFARP